MTEENEPVKPVEIVVGPFAYFVPSFWKFDGTSEDSHVDYYRHESGATFFVERFTMSRDPCGDEATDPAQMLLGMNDPVEERSAVVRLETGFTMVSYSAPVDDPDHVGLFCEFCYLYAPGKVGILRYGSTIDRSELDNPDVVLWSHVIRQFARWSQFDPDRV